MKKKITKDLSPKELDTLLIEKKKALSEFSLSVFQGKIKNVKEGKLIKKDIARILTAKNANRLAAK